MVTQPEVDAITDLLRTLTQRILAVESDIIELTRRIKAVEYKKDIPDQGAGTHK